MEGHIEREREKGGKRTLNPSNGGTTYVRTLFQSIT